MGIPVHVPGQLVALQSATPATEAPTANAPATSAESTAARPRSSTPTLGPLDDSAATFDVPPGSDVLLILPPPRPPPPTEQVALPGGYSVGNRVRSVEALSGETNVQFAELGTVQGGGDDRHPGQLLVMFDGASSKRWHVYLHQVTRASEWTTLLVGGYRRGDRVHSLFDQDDGTNNVNVGDAGMVTGPSQYNDEKLFVEFKGRLWHMLPTEFMGQEEYAAARRSRSSSTDQDVSGASSEAEAAAPMTVTLLSHDPQIMTVENFLKPNEIDTILRVGKPLLRPSQIQDDKDTRGGTRSSERTSWTAFLGALAPLLLFFICLAPLCNICKYTVRVARVSACAGVSVSLGGRHGNLHRT